MNKNGWGLRAELLIILLFVICLAVACIGANKFGLLGKNDNPIIKELTTENNTLFYKNNVSLLLKEDFNNYFNKCVLVKIEEIKTGFLYNLINNILRLIAPLC